jgi:peptidoglycan hydrolase CwlO-like protein
MNKILKIIIKYVLLGFLVFSFTTCLIIFKKNYELNLINKECLSLIDEIEEYQKVIVELETINNEGLSQQDKINKLNERVDSLNRQIEDYKNNISRLNAELGVK